ncbi:hypothetical protein GCM10020000_27700 [Streptomyces olivoverticillatus]
MRVAVLAAATAAAASGGGEGDGEGGGGEGGGPWPFGTHSTDSTDGSRIHTGVPWRSPGAPGGARGAGSAERGAADRAAGGLVGQRPGLGLPERYQCGEQRRDGQGAREQPGPACTALGGVRAVGDP